MESTIIASISTLLAVAITLFFTTKREKNKFMQDLKLKESNDLETFYVSILSSIEKMKTFTTRGEDYKDLINEISILSAKANLLAPNAINEQLAKISDVMYEWSSYYRQSLPTKIEGTSYGMVSNKDSEFRKKANEIYPTLNKEITTIIQLIKEDLKKQKKILNK